MLPALYGFGTNLKFSFGRYLGALILLTIFALKLAARSVARGENVVLFVPIGGGVLSFLLAHVLGHAGLRVLQKFSKAPPSGRGAS
jgi:hypothetical protein